MQTSTFAGTAINSFIESKPTTTIYNLFGNSVNYLQTNNPAGATTSIFIEASPQLQSITLLITASF
jgi:hypothetical protein